MARRIVTLIASALIVVTPSAFALGQGLSSVLGRLNDVEARMRAIEAAQKQEAGTPSSPATSPEQTVSVDTMFEQEMAALRARVDAINAIVSRIAVERQVAAAASSSAPAQVISAPAQVATVKTEVATPAPKRDSAPAAPQVSYLQVKYPVTFYGYIKLDGSYDGSRVNVGNYARWVDTLRGDDGQFNITARQTRLGLNLGGPKIAGTEAAGKLEIDFYGGGEENKNLLLLRHAFMKVAWPAGDFSIIAGQTNDVISPLVPSTINYVVGWWSGNIGYRRPQVRMTKGFVMGRNVVLRFELAAARSIGGEMSGLPTAQGRMALVFPFLAGKKATIGVSGHTGKEENDSRTWSSNLDFSCPILSKTTIEGELWTGENLDSYMGGVGQGLKGTAQDPLEIRARGGWMAISTGPYHNWQFGVGGGIDDPKDVNLVRGDRTQNLTTFGNTRFSINEAVETGLEVSYWQTNYKGMDDATSVRMQWSWIYKF